MRLAKLIAQRGVVSRRKAEALIAAGEVTVNGAVAAVTTPVDPESDVVAVKGVALPGEQTKRYYLLNKPRGYITGRVDTRGRPGVLELAVGLPVRVEPVGRLDYDTEGVLLLTNDGQLAHDLTHPSRLVPKTYLAVVEGTPGRTILRCLREGITLDDGPTAPAKVRLIGSEGGKSLVEITVTEGRNRLVRRMMRQVGHPVQELRRERFATVSLEGLPKGQVRELLPEEVRELRAVAEKRKSRAPGGKKTGAKQSPAPVSDSRAG